jgi:hypothetical protein
MCYPTEDEKEALMVVLNLSVNPSATKVIPLEVHTNEKPNPSYVETLRRNLAIKTWPIHRQPNKENICKSHRFLRSGRFCRPI